MKKVFEQIRAAISANGAELVRDGLALAGVGLLAAGVSVEFGSGWSMMVVGLVLLAVVFMPRRP